MNAQQSEDPEFWRQLNPHLTLTEQAHSRSAPGCVNDFLREGWRERLKEDGYLQFDEVLDEKRVTALRRGVENVVAAKWPAAFCMVYDEYWNLFAGLSSLLQPILGESYRLLPNFWAWHVDPSAQQAGWSPHRDSGPASLFADGMPKSATIWIPLTDATPLNGCMYLLPANQDPDYLNAGTRKHDIPLQSIRALPAKAGSVLLWNQNVYHWGSRSSPRARTPRISIACEYRQADLPPMREPLLDPGQPPAFDLRSDLIVRLLVRYRSLATPSNEER